MAFSTWRPIRPKPLMPTLTVILFLLAYVCLISTLLRCLFLVQRPGSFVIQIHQHRCQLDCVMMVRLSVVCQVGAVQTWVAFKFLVHLDPLGPFFQLFIIP